MNRGRGRYSGGQAIGSPTTKAERVCHGDVGRVETPKLEGSVSVRCGKLRDKVLTFGLYFPFDQGQVVERYHTSDEFLGAFVNWAWDLIVHHEAVDFAIKGIHHCRCRIKMSSFGQGVLDGEHRIWRIRPQNPVKLG